jgi:hypothetical protein
MNCPYCGLDFKEKEARKGCARCSLVTKGCQRVRCPRCGYEMPAEPVWIKRIKTWRKGK